LEILRTLCGVFRAALARAIELGWLWRHESGSRAQGHQGPREKKLRLSDVKKMFAEMRDHRD
jgi:hypothetical protein